MAFWCLDIRKKIEADRGGNGVVFRSKEVEIMLISVSFYEW